MVGVIRYIMFYKNASGSRFIWLGQMRDQDRTAALRNSGHSLEEMTGVEGLAHEVMKNGEIFWEGTFDFAQYEGEATTTADYERWRDRQRREEMISVAQDVSKVNFKENRQKVVIEVVITTASVPYHARMVIGHDLAYRWFQLASLKAASTILFRAKQQMRNNKAYAGAKIWYDVEKAGNWTIEYINIVD